MAASALDRKIQQIILVAALFMAAVAVGILAAHSAGAIVLGGSQAVAETGAGNEALAGSGFEW